MEHYSSLVNFCYRDLPILGRKLSYLQNVVAPEHLDDRVTEVLGLPGLPDLTESFERDEFDMEKLLEIRSSDEGRAFRAWLRKARRALAAVSGNDRARSVGAVIAGELVVVFDSQPRLFSRRERWYLLINLFKLSEPIRPLGRGASSGSPSNEALS
jgi:hypothetical protein